MDVKRHEKTTKILKAGMIHKATLGRYYALTKPKVVALLVVTALVGMFLATPGMVPWQPLMFGTLGITFASASAAVFNQVIDRHIDDQMLRTQKRPLPQGRITPASAIIFGITLGLVGLGVLFLLVNPLTAWLTFFALIGYAIIYTIYLKRATPQNIVIGGASGAAPPVLGWAAVTGTVEPHALLLFLIIFVWTPPHFWALAIHRKEEYAKVGMPMLPVTHGIAFTRLQILLYTILLSAVTILPFLTGMSGLLYLLVAVILNSIFLYYATLLLRQPENTSLPMKTFGYSIWYLLILFAGLLLDHYFPLFVI